MILKDKVCKFEYTKQDGTKSTRVALPIDLVFGRNRKVLVECYDFVRKAIRNFRWENVANAEDVTSKCLVLDEKDENFPFSDPEGFYEDVDGVSTVNHNGKVYVVKV